jgi:RNA polymerase sigma factor (sigma-70 family)
VSSRTEEFEALVNRHSRMVTSAIRRVCARRYGSLVPDIQQEVYVALWNRLGSGKQIEHPTSYVYKVALTTALAVVRKHLPAAEPLGEAEGTASAPGGGGASTFAGLLPPERARLLGEILELLPPDQSRAIRAHLAGFSHEEVASLFGWSESVARHRIYRGIEALKEKMRGGDHRAAQRA